MSIFSFVVLDHWCTYSPSLHDPPNPQHGCLLSSVIDGLCQDVIKKNKNTQGLTHEDNLVRENSCEAKVWKQSQHPERCTVYALRDWRARTLSPGKGDVPQRLGHCGKRLLKQPRRFKVGDFLSSSNCCFKAVLLWHLSTPPPQPLSPPPTPHLDWKDPAVHYVFFIYCTCKRDSVSVICKMKKGDRQRARSLRSVTHILKKKEKKKNNRL